MPPLAPVAPGPRPVNAGLALRILGIAGTIRELVAGNAALAEIADGLLQTRRVLLDRLETYDRKVLKIVRNDAVCQQIMASPGVGPVVAQPARLFPKTAPTP